MFILIFFERKLNNFWKLIVVRGMFSKDYPNLKTFELKFYSPSSIIIISTTFAATIEHLKQIPHIETPSSMVLVKS